MTDKNLSFADLWDAADEYIPDVEKTKEEIIEDYLKVGKRNQWIYLTTEDVKNAKSFDNKLYSEYYEYDCEEFIEDKLEDTPIGDKIIFKNEYMNFNNVVVHEYAQDDEIYLLVDGEDKFIFHGYDTRVINHYENLIIFGGKEEVIIYDIDKKLLKRLD
jgi:hypothetical protein